MYILPPDKISSNILTSISCVLLFCAPIAMFDPSVPLKFNLPVSYLIVCLFGPIINLYWPYTL